MKGNNVGQNDAKFGIVWQQLVQIKTFLKTSEFMPLSFVKS